MAPSYLKGLKTPLIENDNEWVVQVRWSTGP